tara:strand:+ start:1200 stop:1751 length:552 start_codon:yes stop_codon:yes gene_type:complete
MDIKICKTHSKADLIDLINTLNLPLIHSHSDNKKSIQSKLIKSLQQDMSFEDNVYNIHDTKGLKVYLSSKNPKKNLNVKEKKDLMFICKKIIHYCKNDYCIYKSQYNNQQEIKDDMLYITQFGDLPSVRRACKLMNENIMSKERYEPLISPQVQKQLDEKNSLKTTNKYNCQLKKGSFTITFD